MIPLQLILMGTMMLNYSVLSSGAVISFYSASYDSHFSGATYENKSFDLYNITTPSNYTYQMLHFEDTDDITLQHSLTSFSTASICSGSTSTYYYNCHSFAWLYEGELGYVPQDPDDQYWLTNPKQLFMQLSNPCVSSYEYVQNPSSYSYASSIQVGDIICYCQIDPYSRVIDHSAVVISSSNTMSNIMVRSKWQKYPVYNHGIFDHPYYFEGNFFIEETSIYICHVSHSYVYDHSDYIYHYYNTSCCGRTIKSAHDYTHIGQNYVCQTCGFVSSISPYSFEQDI